VHYSCGTDYLRAKPERSNLVCEVCLADMTNMEVRLAYIHSTVFRDVCSEKRLCVHEEALGLPRRGGLLYIYNRTIRWLSFFIFYFLLATKLPHLTK